MNGWPGNIFGHYFVPCTLVRYSDQNRSIDKNKTVGEVTTFDNTLQSPLINDFSYTRLTIRAGSHYSRFCKELFTLAAKICQHTFFLMRPLICGFSKISQNRRKTSKTPVCLGGADRFLQISEKQRNSPSKLSMVVNVELPMKSPGSRNEKRARNFIIHADVFIAYSIEAMDRRDFFFPYGNLPGFYGHQPPNDSYSFHQDVGSTPPFWQVTSTEQGNSESHSPIYRSSPNDSPCTSNSTGSPDAASTSRSEQQGKRSYEKWSEEVKKLLIRLWADNFDYLESKDARKAWERIARELSAKCGTKKTADKCQKKMQYWIGRYKEAKDWNRRQSGGNRKQSVFYEEIDQVLGCRDGVTLRHVAQAGSSSGSTVDVEEGNDEEKTEQEGKKEKRTQRKLSRKRVREDVKDEEEKEMFKAAFSVMEEQRKEMSSFMSNFNRVQEQQTNTMNALVGALTIFLQNNNN